MSISKQVASIGLGIESDNARDGALSGFFSCGWANRLKDYGASDLAALGVSWEERLFHLCFWSSGSRLISYCLLL